MTPAEECDGLQVKGDSGRMSEKSGLVEGVNIGDVPGSNAEGLHREFALERYRYILSEIRTVNENVYKFLAIYQALATALAGAAVALFANYRAWAVAPHVARLGITGLMMILTMVSCFSSLLILIGVLSWLDYRHEECELTDKLVYVGFRKRPRVRNLFRWYETYIILFIFVSTVLMWIFTSRLLIPAIQ